MISGIANLVNELPHKLLNDLRLGILGNKEILGKSQIWMETQPSVQSPFQKLNFGSNSQKTCQSRYQTFLDLSSFTGFLLFVQKKFAQDCRIFTTWEAEMKLLRSFVSIDLAYVLAKNNKSKVKSKKA